MASIDGALPVSHAERPQHRRNKSASVLKSILPSKASKSRKNDGDDAENAHSGPGPDIHGLMLPADHPHAGPGVLGEIRNLSSGPSSPRKSQAEGRPALYKSSKSADSTTSMEKEKIKSGSRTPKDGDSPKKPKKTKSSTNLANLFGKNKSQKDLSLSPAKPPKDKENTTPPSSAHTQPTAPPPIWAQFATQKPPELYEEQSTTSTVPLNDEKETLREIIKYNPAAYSPSKQKDFSEIGTPTLGNKRSQRPKSIEIAAASARNLFQPLSRKPSHGKDNSRKSSDEGRSRGRREPERHADKPDSLTREGNPASPTKGTRVMAAVATFNDRAKDAELEALINDKDLDAKFEAVLDSRNIPEPMREKMRTLTARLKADFIRSNSLEGRQSPPGTAGGSNTIESREASKADTRSATKSKRSTKSKHDNDAVDEDDLDAEPATPKRARPRSRAFTFSKGDSSPSKKMKGDLEGSPHKRDKPTDISKSASASTTSLALGAQSDSSVRSQKGGKAVASKEYVQYLHDTTDTQQVEVGRLHKLRILLRNETVGWVDTFISEGGMTEIIALLHRIMDVEWRNEHDDALLHEALLCLKGILTTALALQKLCEVEDTLFPALLNMIFSKDRKGPADYTTRTTIISILFMHLAAVANDADKLPDRARRILTYLEDAPPPEDKQTHAWITGMQQRRPYKTWCKELTNISKEVFWIFIHNLNVVSLPGVESQAEPKPVAGTPEPSDKPLPPTPGPAITTTTTTSRPTTSASQAPHSRQSETYAQRHFPPTVRPAVPAAPYVGGVEWDATHYISAHLDLLNGLVAALPSRAERNGLRGLLRLSDFERVLAGLRTCKEKFYGAVHCGLRGWVGAAAEDGWEVRDVRFGMREEAGGGSPVKRKGKKKEDGDAAPKLDVGLPFEVGDRIGGGALGKPGDAKWEYDDFGTKRK